MRHNPPNKTDPEGLEDNPFGLQNNNYWTAVAAQQYYAGSNLIGTYNSVILPIYNFAASVAADPGIRGLVGSWQIRGGIVLAEASILLSPEAPNLALVGLAAASYQTAKGVDNLSASLLGQGFSLPPLPMAELPPTPGFLLPPDPGPNGLGGNVIGVDPNTNQPVYNPRGYTSSGSSSSGPSSNGFTGSVVGYGNSGPTAGSITGSLLGDLEANAPSNNKDK